MNTANNVLLVRVPAQGAVDGRELRDYILESLARGVLVLTEDASCEVMELPPLGGVAVRDNTRQSSRRSQDSPAAAQPEPEDIGAEKRAIVQRLKDFREAHGRGCLTEVSARTARRKDRRISDDVLRHICADGAPKMPMADWRSIARALDALEAKEAEAGNG